MAHLLAQDVLIELCSDGMSAGDPTKTLAELLKLVGYNNSGTFFLYPRTMSPWLICLLFRHLVFMPTYH
jgi:hypothetical protein